MSDERNFILAEIKRLYAQTGRSPGIAMFSEATGIPKHRILGIHWPRWSDALAEVGLAANSLTQKLNSDELLEGLALFTRTLGRYPSQSDIKFAKRQGANLANPDVYPGHFGNADGVKLALADYCKARPDLLDVLPLVPAASEAPSANEAKLGHVYLLQSGEHFKIGRTDTLERRIREISVAMPSKVNLIHTITTDDPIGIEGYWHRRFANRRANGEWFRLTREDVAAFRRRKFQ